MLGATTFDRSNLVSRTIEGKFGWNRDTQETGTVAEYRRRFPNLPPVRDGREETGNTRAGRGTTAFDLFRSRESGGLILYDFLSIKTDLIGEDNKLPSRIDLSTGNRRTLDAILEGVNAGSSIPTLIFCSENNIYGDPRNDGFALFLDLAPILRGGVQPIEAYPDGGYKKGKAPLCYMRWSSRRKCGDKGKFFIRLDREFPYIDENGNRWVAPDYVCYPELSISFSKLGIDRSTWRPINILEIPYWLERQNWDTMTG